MVRAVEQSNSLRFSERLLLRLSRPPGTFDYIAEVEPNLSNALSQLERAFPGFLHRIAGKEIVDFGCGDGWQAVGLAKNGAGRVLGIDTNPKALTTAHELVQRFDLSGQVQLAARIDADLKGAFDLVISQNSMEHVSDPVRALEDMKSLLKPGGEILITFGPPWLSPYGSHMSFFTKIPWVNLLFDERTILAVRARFRNDDARRYEEVESGLNKMTVAKFERLIAVSGFRVKYRRHDCVKRLNFLGKLPYVRELFINCVSYALTVTQECSDCGRIVARRGSQNGA